MARELHYKYFKDLYDEENKRGAEVGDNAKTNTGLVALYGAFITFGVTQPDNRWFEIGIFVLSIATLFTSLFMSLAATNIASYQVPNFPETVFELLPDYDDDEIFYEDRVVDLVQACKANTVINDKKAKLLTSARYLLLIGVALHFGYSIIRVATFGGFHG